MTEVDIFFKFYISVYFQIFKTWRDELEAVKPSYLQSTE